jgi:hypothetical protein
MRLEDTLVSLMSERDRRDSEIVPGCSDQRPAHTLAFCFPRNGKNCHVTMDFVREIVAPSIQGDDAYHTEPQVLGDEERRTGGRMLQGVGKGSPLPRRDLMGRAGRRVEGPQTLGERQNRRSVRWCCRNNRQLGPHARRLRSLVRSRPTLCLAGSHRGHFLKARIKRDSLPAQVPGYSRIELATV